MLDEQERYGLLRKRLERLETDISKIDEHVYLILETIRKDNKDLWWSIWICGLLLMMLILSTNQ